MDHSFDRSLNIFRVSTRAWMMSEGDRTNRENGYPAERLLQSKLGTKNVAESETGSPLGVADATAPRQAPALHQKGKKRAKWFFKAHSASNEIFK